MKNDNNATFTVSPLNQARSRWRGSLRHMLLGLDPTVHHPVGEGEPTFMTGDPLNIETLRFATAWMDAGETVTGEEQELIYVEFADEGDTSEPRNIHVIAKRDGVFFIRRDCTLWVDPTGRRAALMSPSPKGGHFVIKGDEIINLPGRPASSTTAGFARASARLRELAGAMLDEEAQCCFEPLRQAA